MTDEQLYAKARKRVEELKGFYVHLIMYLLVNAGLVVLNLLTSPQYLWFVWPAFGWGIGVVAHGVSVLGAGRFFGSDWEEREFMEQERRRQGPPAP
jgi:2TM domain